MEKFNEFSYLPTRHLQSFWGASGDFWQAQWDKFIDKFGKLAQTKETSAQKNDDEKKKMMKKFAKVSWRSNENRMETKSESCKCACTHAFATYAYVSVRVCVFTLVFVHVFVFVFNHPISQIALLPPIQQQQKSQTKSTMNGNRFVY